MAHSNLAVPELTAIEIHGMTRSSFIMRGALAAGAVYGAGAITPFVRQAIAQGDGGDVDILNFALTLEFLEEAFYKQAVKEVKLSKDVKPIAEQILDDESKHVDFLKEAISGAGAEPTKAPKVDFGNAFKSEKSFLKLAQTFEDTGVSAYNGAAPQIQDKKILGAAGTIVQIEGRHAALIRFLRGEDITPSAFDKPLEMEEVLEAVKPFVKS